MARSTAVALFTYNRPWHTRQVLEGLRRNAIDELHVLQDGLRQGDPAEPHRAVSELIGAIDFCRARIDRRTENIGLARSIIGGVSSLLETHDSIVVLEDDCVPSPVFLSWMREMLERIRDQPRVFSIGGYALPEFPVDYGYDVCFTPLPSSWGWATWKDRWSKFDPAATGWDQILADTEMRRAFDAPGTIFSRLLETQMEGRIDSWAIRWYLTIVRNHGVCAWPLRSFIANVGMDGTGVHGDDTDAYDVTLCKQFQPSALRRRRRSSSTRASKRSSAGASTTSRLATTAAAEGVGEPRPPGAAENHRKPDCPIAPRSGNISSRRSKRSRS
jgi:hypothetical protein